MNINIDFNFDIIKDIKDFNNNINVDNDNNNGNTNNTNIDNNKKQVYHVQLRKLQYL